jgi:hypothetical protein
VTAPAFFSAAHLRALRRLALCGASKLARWKRMSRRHDRVRLRSETAADLWTWRLVQFDWEDLSYRVTRAGRALIEEADAALLFPLKEAAC